MQATANAAIVPQTAGEGRNAMPALAGTLTAEQIRDVAAYVSARLAN